MQSLRNQIIKFRRQFKRMMDIPVSLEKIQTGKTYLLTWVHYDFTEDYKKVVIMEIDTTTRFYIGKVEGTDSTVESTYAFDREYYLINWTLYEV